MKNNTIKLLPLAVSLVLTIGSAQAANMSYAIYADLEVNLPTEASLSNQNGRVWLGNFGSDANGTLLSLASIQAGVPNLLNSFRPLTSFVISGGSLLGDTGYGLRGSYNVGSSSVSAGNFAGQDAYILALSSTSSVWTDALASWQVNGALNAILVRSANNFTLATNDPTVDFEVAAGPGATLVFGNQTASSITATTVPEPSVTTLLLFGAAGLGALRLRRQTV
jgi:hypothetical protein